MKKLLPITATALIISASLHAQLKINTLGRVGIGTPTPSTTLHVTGTSTLDGTLNNPTAATTLSIIAPAGTTGGGIVVQGGPTAGATNGVAVSLKPVNNGSSASRVTGVLSFISGDYVTGGAVAVHGFAGSGADGSNVGVAGIVADSRKGVGVYGSAGTFMLGPPIVIDAGNFWAGYFSGNVKVTGSLTVNTTLYTSDKRLKKEINSINQETYDKLSQLTAFQYKYKTNKELIGQGLLKTTFAKDKSNKEVIPEYDNIDRNRYGFMAQDVQKIYPELVYEDGNGLLAIDYVGLIPLMIEGMKEQNAKVEDLKEQLANTATTPTALLEEKIAELDKQIKNCCQAAANQNGSSTTVSNQPNGAALYQNTPNPFSIEAQIKCFIPKQSQTSQLFIYNLQGKQLLKKQISEKENVSVNISGSELGGAGTYLYTLIIDGKEIDTKKMILTE